MYVVVNNRTFRCMYRRLSVVPSTPVLPESWSLGPRVQDPPQKVERGKRSVMLSVTELEPLLRPVLPASGWGKRHSSRGARPRHQAAPKSPASELMVPRKHHRAQVIVCDWLLSAGMNCGETSVMMMTLMASRRNIDCRNEKQSASNAASQSASDTVSCSVPAGTWRPGKVRQKTTRKQKPTRSSVPLNSHTQKRRGPAEKPAAAHREASNGV